MLARVLLVVLALTQGACALRVATPASTAVVSRAAVSMAFPSIEDARSLTSEEIELEIFNAKKVGAHYHRPVSPQSR